MQNLDKYGTRKSHVAPMVLKLHRISKVWRNFDKDESGMNTEGKG